jgi:predicted dehydrogenase
MNFLDGVDERLVSSVEDAYRTMALVEAAYESSSRGGTPVSYD